jgi:hypothetical protein
MVTKKYIPLHGIEVKSHPMASQFHVWFTDDILSMKKYVIVGESISGSCPVVSI